MSEPFIAEVQIVPYQFNPRGWAYCDGQLLPISQNTALFSLLGTTYGGDGRTTFGLPNMSDRVPMHPGRGPGLTPRVLGERSGIQTVTLVESQLPNHTHSVNASITGSANADTPSSQTAFSAKRPMYHAGSSSLVNMSSSAVGSTGGGQSHNNEQPYLTMSFVIALVGLYPSRG